MERIRNQSFSLNIFVVFIVMALDKVQGNLFEYSAENSLESQENVAFLSNPNCVVTEANIRELTQVMEQAARLLSNTEFTKRPVTWEKTCQSVFTFIEDKARYIENDSGFLYNAPLPGNPTYESRLSVLEKEILTFAKLIHVLKQSYGKTFNQFPVILRIKLLEWQAKVGTQKALLNLHLGALNKPLLPSLF